MDNNELLKKLYYDPKTGYTNSDNLYRRAKQINPNITMKIVKNFVKSQAITQIYEPVRNIRQQYIPIKCPLNSVGCIQMDLVDIQRFSKFNSGMKFIVVFVDVQTRYAWIYAIKNKTPGAVLEKLKIVVDEIRNKYPENPLTITSDEGNEFKGTLKKYMNAMNIKHISSLNKTSTAIVERMNKTLWNFIKRFTETTGTLKFVHKLSDFAENYNNNYHKTLQETPLNCYNDIRKSDNKKQRKYQPLPPLKYNDKVRYELGLTNEFEKKSFRMQFSKNIYYVVGKQYNRYILSKQPDGSETLDKTYLRRQLKLIDKSEKPDVENEIPKQLNIIRADRQHKQVDKQIKITQKSKPYRNKRLSARPAGYRPSDFSNPKF